MYVCIFNKNTVWVYVYMCVFFNKNSLYSLYLCVYVMGHHHLVYVCKQIGRICVWHFCVWTFILRYWISVMHLYVKILWYWPSGISMWRFCGIWVSGICMWRFVVLGLWHFHVKICGVGSLAFVCEDLWCWVSGIVSEDLRNWVCVSI